MTVARQALQMRINITAMPEEQMLGSRFTRDYAEYRAKANGKDFMEYLIGVAMAVAVYAFAMMSGFDRERVFYPTVLVVVAHYYILFAAMGSSTSVLARNRWQQQRFWW